MWGTILICSFFSAIALAADDTKKWGYVGNDGPYTWADNWSTCSPSINPRQSPVNLHDAIYNPALMMPSPAYDYSLKQAVTWKNLGLHIQFKFDNVNILTSLMDNGNMRQYKLNSGHFHWGREYMPGSEHTVNGQQHKAELHLVHYATDVPGANATTTPDSILVIGIFIDEDSMMTTSDDSPAYVDLFEQFSKIQAPYSNATSSVTPIELIPDYKEGNNQKFYHYKGGLTTPGCYGVVNWLVVTKPIRLSSTLIKKYFYETGPKQMFEDKELPQGGNFRPIQGLGSRIVFTNDMSIATGQITDSANSAAAVSSGTTLMLVTAALLSRFF